MLLTLALGCSDYNVSEKKDPPAVDTGRPDDPRVDTGETGLADTAGPGDTADSAPPDTAPVDTGGPPPEEVCNGTDDDLDGEVDEGFDTNGNGIPDCTETEAYCTPFDDFSEWSYAGSGDWAIDGGLLREGRSGTYDAIAWLSDLGYADRFSLEVRVAWTGALNDLVGVAWAVSGRDAFVVRWDDPQGDYGRYSPPGAIDVAWCDEGVCSTLVVDSSADLYRPADLTFSTLLVYVDHDHVAVRVDGVVVLDAIVPEVAGSGPGVVGLYSNDNDGVAWFDDFCVWVDGA